MIGLTKRSHVAPKMQHVTFCDSIGRFDWCLTKRIDTVCGVTWIPLCAIDGSVIAWGRGEGDTLSIHVVSTQCARGLTKRIDTVCEVTWIPLCARDGSVIRWGRGEGEALSIHVVSTQCARGLRVRPDKARARSFF